MTNQEFAQKSSDYCISLINLASQFKPKFLSDWTSNTERWTALADRIMTFTNLSQVETGQPYRIHCIAMMLNSSSSSQFLRIVKGLNYADAIIDLLCKIEQSEDFLVKLYQKEKNLDEIVNLTQTIMSRGFSKETYKTRYHSLLSRLGFETERCEKNRDRMVELLTDLLFDAYDVEHGEESSAQMRLRFGIEQQANDGRGTIIVNSHEVRMAIERRSQLSDLFWSEILPDDPGGNPDVKVAKAACDEFVAETTKVMTECANIEDVLELLRAMKKAEGEENPESNENGEKETEENSEEAERN